MVNQDILEWLKNIVMEETKQSLKKQPMQVTIRPRKRRIVLGIGDTHFPVDASVRTEDGNYWFYLTICDDGSCSNIQFHKIN